MLYLAASIIFKKIYELITGSKNFGPIIGSIEYNIFNKKGEEHYYFHHAI